MSSETITMVSKEETINDLYLLIGLLFAFVAEFWSGMGGIQIKYSHKLDALASHSTPEYKRPRWWFGFSMFIMNMIFKFTSYMFASLNILAPTSAFVIVINAILARIYFREQMTVCGYIGSALIMLGCTLAILFGTHSRDQLQLRNLFIKASSAQFMWFATVHAALCVICGLVGSILLRQKTLSHLQPSLSDFENSNESEIEHINRELDNSEDNENSQDKLLPAVNAGHVSPTDNSSHDNDNADDKLVPQNERSAIFPQQVAHVRRQQEWRHILRCCLLAFSNAGLMAWVQFLAKIVADLFYESIWNSNNQFHGYVAYVVLIILFVMLVLELYMLSEIMRIFDALLIVPVYTSLLILSSIALSGVYWNNFKAWTLRDVLLFSLGLLCISGGIAAVSYGQKRLSVAHHEVDKRRYIKRAKQRQSHGERVDKIPSFSGDVMNVVDSDVLP